MKIKIQKTFLRIVLGLFACMAEASAQSYYPGGLGNSNLVVWLSANRAGSITQNGSNQVSQWSDLSGNGYNFTQGIISEEPVYGAAASPSGRPALGFTSTSTQYLSTPSLPASIVFTAGVSAFAVASYNADQTAQGWQRIFDFGNGAASNNFMMGRDGNSQNTYYEGWKGGAGDQTWTTTNPIVNGSENIYEAVQQGAAAGTLTSVAHYLAGTAQAATGAVGSSETWVPAAIARTSNYIGRSNWNADNYFSGTMSEILMYNTAFNTTQRVILENYVSVEWNQTVSVSKYTPPTTTTYTTNLVGIGYTSAADNFLTDVAGSTDGLGFSSSSGATGFLNTAGYIVAAHNGQSNTVISNASIPGITSANPLSLWNRSWQVQKTGGNAAGQVTFNFNSSDYNGTTPSGAQTYALLYNATDGTFTTGTNQLIATVSTTVAGNIVAFLANISNIANGYYTIIYSSSAITLPIVLADFQAIPETGASLLQWTVATGADPATFDIERSTDAVQFASIGYLSGGADSSTPGQYSFIDQQPVAGVDYYRLKMTDIDGNVLYSRICSLDFNGGTATGLLLYPNPARDQLTISMPGITGVVEMRIINAAGSVLYIRQLSSTGLLQIPIGSLASGVYFIEVRHESEKYIQSFIKS
jgi:Secretion system C-terminal sorting domain